MIISKVTKKVRYPTFINFHLPIIILGGLKPVYVIIYHRKTKLVNKKPANYAFFFLYKRIKYPLASDKIETIRYIFPFEEDNPP